MVHFCSRAVFTLFRGKLSVVEAASGREVMQKVSFRESPLAALVRLLHGGICIQEFTTVFLLVLKLESET